MSFFANVESKNIIEPTFHGNVNDSRSYYSSTV